MQSRILLSVKPENVQKVKQLAEKQGVPFGELGSIGKDQLIIKVNEGVIIDQLSNIKEAWKDAIPCLMT